MDPGEGYVKDSSLWRGELEWESPNVIELSASYLHHFTPIKFTTELKMLTREVEARWLMKPVPWILDNAITPSMALAIAKGILPLPKLARAGIEPAIWAKVPSGVGEVKLNEWAIETDYSMEAAQPIEISKAEEVGVGDLRKALLSVPMPALSGEIRASGREWFNILAINRAPIGRGPKGAPVRLIFQELVEATRQEAEEIRAALAQFREGLEELLFGPPRAAPVLTKGAIRTRGALPSPKGARTIETTILTEAWEAGEELNLKVERGPQIRQGRLDLSLTAPAKLAGRTASIVLSMEGMEILLGSVAIESAGRGKARIELGIDLGSVGIEIEDGILPLKAFRVFIEPRPLNPEEERVG
jgi:hypothetical protein